MYIKIQLSAQVLLKWGTDGN